MAFCGNCGAAVAPGTKFCPSCGAPAAADARQEHATMPEPPPPSEGAGQFPAGRTADIFSAENLKKMFLSSEGRLNRRPFILYSFPLLFLIGSIDEFVGETAGTLLSLALFYSIGCLMMRRLHDMGQNAALLIVIVVLAVLSNIVSDPNLDEVLSVVVVVLYLYLCCKEGTRGLNAYGLDPLEWQH